MDPTMVSERLHRFLAPMPKPKPPIDPALLKHEQERAEARQNRLADGMTTFAGSMLFVYIHIIWFACWIGFGVESYPLSRQILQLTKEVRALAGRSDVQGP
jgi:hypothetical protein